ncbi:hypothetical protein [Streptobacillus felis]
MNCIIGGSNGCNEDVRNISECKLSFSKMTCHTLINEININRISL